MAAGNVDGLEKQDFGESLCPQSVLLTLFSHTNPCTL